MKKDPVILYHGNCFDGFGAAWAAWKKFGPGAHYQPVQYGGNPPSFDGPFHLYLLDFCFPRKTIETLRSQLDQVTVIDHHRSAMKALDGLDCTIFDLDKSAAVLTWEHFFPGETVPRLLLYIQDYDLWKFELPNSREVAAGLSSHPMEFEVWNGLEPDRLAKDGRPLLKQQNELVKLIADQARLETIEGHLVPSVNATALGSEVGQELLRRFPNASFSVSFYDRADGLRHWSLRSRPDFDVSAIAKKYGGGGHKQAAGFETRLPKGGFVPPATPSPNED
jgi:oligoribonuclease NrnB/cAMP/cGMP phosphodiesterase (DHH superfamily)